MTETTGRWDPARATRQTRCERCGTTFGCRNLGEEGSCWCSLEAFRLPVPLPEGVGPFGDCLCPACLRSIAAELAARRAELSMG
ncbi:MAG TPA: cysteine-rich CWC family protein [Candidatus Limnocylindrales bacterium]